ncbi:MAG: hypothetical protein DRP74_07715 [Candidatus Omnitrophota bacterium]|nr:MAG: hypothetical protein DRP74_07715 [Candidatus Omnitrophota bacterium]
MGYKSRGNWHLGVCSDEKWTQIFGTTRPQAGQTGRISLKDKPRRGDYKFCRELDKVLRDYTRFKSPKDREKIKDEYFGRQKEQREKVRRELDRLYPDRFKRIDD